MAGGISINILSNVRDAVKGVDDVADALDDAHSALRDLTKEGDSAADRMEGDFRDISRAADKSSDQLRDKFRAAYREVKGSADNAADAAVKSQRRIGEKSAEVGQEVRQNLGEGIANAARGDFESLADSIGDTFGGAVAGIGGIATAGVAAAGALGIGALVAALSAVEENLAAARERGVELAQVMYQNEGRVPLADRVQELITVLGSERLARNPFEQIARNFVDLGTNITMSRKAAEVANIPLAKLIEGLSGSSIRNTSTSLEAVNAALEKMNKESGNVNLDDFAARQNALTGVRDELQKVIEAQKLSDELYKSTEFIDAQKMEDAAERSKAALQKATDDWASRLKELSGLWQGAAVDAANYFSETEEGSTAFDWTAYLTDAETTVAAADEMKRRLVTLPDDIRAEAERIFAAQGAVAANEYTRAYETASVADQGRFVAAAAANGDAAGRSQAAALKAAFGNPELVAHARVEIDDASFWNHMSILQRRAEQGITVQVRAGSGRLYE